jgi:hypothetical protein
LNKTSISSEILRTVASGNNRVKTIRQALENSGVRCSDEKLKSTLDNFLKSNKLAHDRENGWRVLLNDT